jgi:hypothetical protein
MTAILGFALQVCGFTNRELRERLAPLLGFSVDQISDKTLEGIDGFVAEAKLTP